MNLGHGHRRSVLILWMWTALLSGFVLYPTLTGQNPTYLPFGIAALAVVLYTVLHPSVRQRRRANGRDSTVSSLPPPSGAPQRPTTSPPPAARQIDDTSAAELPTIEIDH
jgi:UDP-GlcNAc:undecaprenyl-phosphate GlcNAc-1-phosphate transferase